MSDFSKRFFIGLFATTVVVFVLMAVSASHVGKPSVVSNAIGVVTTPIEHGFSAVGRWLYGIYDFFKDTSICKKENEELKTRVRELEQSVRYTDSYKSENERLLGLLDMKERYENLNLVGARVVGKDSGSWFNTLTVNKGSNDGVKFGSVVISKDGLVGSVYEVGYTWSKVKTVLDIESAISAISPRTNDKGVVEGDLSLADIGQCKMTYISKGAKIVAGDEIETSMMGGLFPEGILIGKVVSVSDDEQDLSLTAIIQSAVDFENLSEVLIERGE